MTVEEFQNKVAEMAKDRGYKAIVMRQKYLHGDVVTFYEASVNRGNRWANASSYKGPDIALERLAEQITRVEAQLEGKKKS